MSILAFLITIGILVIVHEYGHFLVARLFNVKILEFSIGFGPQIFKFKGNNNIWSIRSIPLGGYVSMLDSRIHEVKEDEKELAFNYKKPYQKILIALAGPLFNILFAIIAYYFLAIGGVSELRPVIASVNPEIKSIDNLPLKAGMIIDEINGKKVFTWNEADKLFNLALKKDSNLELTVSDKEHSRQQINLNLATKVKNFAGEVYLETLGVYPISYLSKIAYVEPNSRAASAGLRINDEIISVNGVAQNNWFYIAEIIKNSAGQLIKLKILRQNKELNIGIRPELIDLDGLEFGRIGIMPAIDDKEIDKNSFIKHYNYVDALNYAVMSCYSIVAINLSTISGIVTGKVSVKNLGGPISIAVVGSKAIHEGIKQFIDFLALISLGLGIMNLLPIPVLDGGHILVYTVEWIIGHEISYGVQMLIYKIGFLFILGLSCLVIYNDILRI